ncbi:MAG: hypothetical protein U9O82_04490 [Thermodesulfobacteriota bacterium]|nr:hypothetical protein [Thermodesulfobacteriota bacterium]
MEGARGIEPPPGFADRANGFEARGAPSTIAPEKQGRLSHIGLAAKDNTWKYSL